MNGLPKASYSGSFTEANSSWASFVSFSKGSSIVLERSEAGWGTIEYEFLTSSGSASEFDGSLDVDIVFELLAISGGVEVVPGLLGAPRKP